MSGMRLTRGKRLAGWIILAGFQLLLVLLTVKGISCIATSVEHQKGTQRSAQDR